MRAVILITGISAAGKSTVAQALAERLPRSAHVRGDTFRRMVVNGGADMTPMRTDGAVRQLHLRYRIAACTADLYFEAGFTPIVQDVVLGEDLERFTRMIRSRPLHVVVLAPSVEVVERRERARAKTGYGDWTAAQLDHVLRHDTPRIGHWLDTSDQTSARPSTRSWRHSGDHLADRHGHIGHDGHSGGCLPGRGVRPSSWSRASHTDRPGTGQAVR